MPRGGGGRRIERGACQPIRRRSSIRWRRSSNRPLRPCSSTFSTAAKLPIALVPKPKPHAASPSALPASTDIALPAARATSSSPHLQARPQRSSAAGLGAEEGAEGQRLASLLPVERRDVAAVEGSPSSAAKPPLWRSSNRSRRRAPRRRRRGGAGDGGNRRWREPTESVGEGAARRRTRLALPATPRRGLAEPSRPRSVICREQEVREEEGGAEVREEEALPPGLPRRRRRGCLRGERERIFSSPLSSDAKCIPCMPALLESVS
ncbi:hypothetical protein PVAP13_9KG314271 [Panicum virgatum]|uniref:Uncharacterized protein n=1 Tax=Panicum virgatum TaxID=38727 RepID=A0A8T0NQJ7_PANVG|nr:hypothetical protein PVAP13_9KG314271 [Panicum virgatum]